MIMESVSCNRNRKVNNSVEESINANRVGYVIQSSNAEINLQWQYWVCHERMQQKRMQ